MASEPVQMLVIFTPKAGKLNDLITLCEEGAEHHKALSACTKWLCSREINSKDGEGSLILVQEWTSVEALIDHSKWEYSVNMRDKIAGLTTSFEYKMSKVCVGFSR